MDTTSNFARRSALPKGISRNLCCGWFILPGLKLYLFRLRKWNANMKWKPGACKKAQEAKSKQDPSRSTCSFSVRYHRHSATRCPLPFLPPHGGSQTGPPGNIHQALSKNYARAEKGECKCSQRLIYYSRFDFPLSFMQHSPPVRNIQNYYGSGSWHTNSRREPKHF